jgi:hypothetical protein
VYLTIVNYDCTTFIVHATGFILVCLSRRGPSALVVEQGGWIHLKPMLHKAASIEIGLEQAPFFPHLNM